MVISGKLIMIGFKRTFMILIIKGKGSRMKNSANVLVIALLLALLVSMGVPPAMLVVAQEAPTSPNIVLILTDDQDLTLDSMDYMPLTRELIGQQGMTFENFFAPVPLCCPARASLLRGQHAHNTDILWNLPPLGGFQKFFDLGMEDATIATALQDAGYRTALIGKYLNGYPDPDKPTHVPPGWDRWWVPTTDSAYASYDYTVNEDGDLVYYGEDPDDYITDVIAAQTIRFITETSRLSQETPFFVMASIYAPHSPSVPAPRHTDLYSDAVAPRTPSFNESDMSDKPPFMQAFPSLTISDTVNMNIAYRNQKRSLAAVDELVASVIQTLDNEGLLSNTYVVFTSDNGLHMGQHRVLSGKGMPYEADIRMPLLIRGPGVPTDVVRNDLTAIIDLAPTFADIAGAELAVPSDGRSLLPLLHDTEPQPWRTAILLEHWQPPINETTDSRLALEAPDPGDAQLMGRPSSLETPDYSGIRTLDYKIIKRVRSAVELYDIDQDWDEIYNQAGDATDDFRNSLQAWLTSLLECAGDTCVALDGQVPPAWELQYARSDINRDGNVDTVDTDLVVGCWNQTVVGECGDRNDLNYDADIGVIDIQTVVWDWENTSVADIEIEIAEPEVTQVTSVPELEPLPEATTETTPTVEIPAGLEPLEEADALLKAGRFDEAVVKYQELVDSDSNHRGYLMGLARSLGAIGRSDEAITLFDQVSRQWPDYPWSYIRRAELLITLGRQDDALRDFRAAAMLNDNDADSHFVLGFAFLELGQEEEGIAELEAGLLLAPDREGPRNTLERLRQTH